LRFIDTQFLGTEALGIAVLSPGRLDLAREVACFKRALSENPIFASRIVGERESELWLEFDPSAARIEPRMALGMRREQITADHVDLLAGDFLSSVGGITSKLVATPLQDGFALCFTTSHVAGDAFSILCLLRSWICAQLGAPPPKRSRQREHRLSADDLAAIDPQPLTTALPEQAAQAKRKRETVTLRAQELELLMKESGGTLHHAAFVLLLRSHRDRLFRDVSRIRLRIPVDIRGLMPGLDDEYVGNAFVDGFAEVDEAELDGDPRVLVERIGRAIARAKQPEFLTRVLALVPHGLEPTGHWLDEQGPLDFKRDVILSSLLGRVAPAGLNLGKGPVAFIGKAQLPRGYLLLPGQGNDVEVEVRLRSELDPA
jgi:hypothetical protein